MRLVVVLLVSWVAAAQQKDQLEPLDIRHVKVGGEMGRRIEVTIRNNLLALDAPKDFLAPFEAKKDKGGYIGLGKLIQSAVRLAAYTGDPKVAALKDELVRRTIAAQGDDGYIGYFQPQARMGALWDVHESGYVIAGLTDDYLLFGSKASLAAAVKAADYLLGHWKELPLEWSRRTGVATHVAVTGIERTLLSLARATGDARYSNFVLIARSLPEWNLPIVIGRRAGIEGHIYAYMARSLALIDLSRMRAGQGLLEQADRAVEFLTRGEGMAVTGGAGQWEIWTGDQDGRGQLAETCATAYTLRVMENLLRLRGESRYGDVMERMIFNTLFAAQSPDGRRIRYYSPLEGPREYHPGDTYCCPGNYRRIVSELPEMIYYRSAGAVTVNLYTASEARFELDGTPLQVRQETTYPAGGEVVVRVDPSKPATFALRMRIPAYAQGARLSVNGQPEPAPAAGTFAAIAREWKAGDTVRLMLPMEARLVLGRQRQAGRAAVLRGPLVFALDPSREGALGGLDAADLGRFTLDPESLEVIPDESLHPGGVAVRVGAWKPGYGTQGKHDLRLTLTEFPDPGGRATYFKLRDLAGARNDELLGPFSARR